MQTARQITPYDQLLSLPETLVGELIGGQLHTHPRPTGPHALAHSVLEMDIGSAYQRGRGGPGGWWIIDEPELHFVRDTEVLVPDLAGWRKQRMPSVPEGHRFEITPDWVCEVLSPSTASTDRTLKMPVYAYYGVRYAWLVDPLARTLEAFEAERGHWGPPARFIGGGSIRVPPFEEMGLELGDLWR